jgi:hypothetical protein
MIPVFQTKFIGGSGRGNCLAAALASILEIPLELVPQFEECFDTGGAKWRLAHDRFLFGHGLAACRMDSDPMLGHPYLATGLSPRSTEDNYCRHIVVYQNGQMVHDPHPSGAGLLDTDGFTVIHQVLRDTAYNLVNQSCPWPYPGK